MKRSLQNTLKVGAAIALMLSAGAVSAQKVTGSTDFGKETAAAALGSEGGFVKVIDNKGTIKYLQAKNGVSMFTDLAPNGGVVTTWQLGGTLTDKTYIDVDGQEFGIKNIKAINNDAVTATAADKAATEYNVTGYTVMVRDEATGEIKKLLATDLVSGIRYSKSLDDNQAGDFSITVAGLPQLDEFTTSAKLFLFRNGAKLRAGVDFITEIGKVTLKGSADLPLYKDDQIEIQYIK